MAENMIYVAGNPDLYPMEYYDQETDSFQGVIPQLLSRFAKQSGYDLRYHDVSSKDHREELAKNLQVDIISGCVGEEQFRHTEGDEILLLDTVEDGTVQAYRILVTDVAPEGLAEDLRSFISQISQEEMNGLVLTGSRQEIKHTKTVLWPLVLALVLAVAVAALAGALAWMIRRNRKQVRALQEERDKDALTGIGNKTYLFRKFPKLVRDGNRILYSMYYFYVDAEHMNRMTSRAQTNEFLRYIANVLDRHKTDTELLARVSDGGFAVLRRSPGDDEAKKWFAPLLQDMKGFAESNGKPYVSHSSVGIYRLRQQDRDLHEILFNVGHCARVAYQESLDYRICTEEFMNEIALDRKLQADVGNGLKFGQFELYVQFYVNARTGRISGGEALSRWEHPDLGFLPPGRFVPLMENEGLIGQLDYYNFDKVCAFLAELRHNGINYFFMSCNFSRDTISMKEFVPKCTAILEKYEFDRRLLIFEITESASIRNMEAVRRNIAAIRQMGIHLALDDFGQGVTSLFDLRDYPVDVLKLDKAMVDIIETDAGKVISEAMIKIGHSLGMTVLAGGVENDNQVRLLQDMQCDIIQGYRFYQPMPAWDVTKKLLAYHKDKGE